MCGVSIIEQTSIMLQVFVRTGVQDHTGVQGLELFSV